MAERKRRKKAVGSKSGKTAAGKSNKVVSGIPNKAAGIGSNRAVSSNSSKAVAVLVFLGIFVLLNIILALPSTVLYEYGIISYNALYFTSDATLSMSFSLTVICYFVFYRKMGFKQIAESVGLKGSKVFGFNRVLLGILIFLILLVLEITVGIISYITNVQINSNVDILLASAPIWFYVFTAVIAPLNEEILFRGFLVPRIGIIASAVIFALGHVSYNSTFGIEVIAAFIFGLLAGYAYKRTGSLYPSLIAHILLNASTLLLTFMVLL